MKNYTTTNKIIKDLMINYIKNLSNGVGKVDTHFLTDITNGIISNNSVVLSDLFTFCFSKYSNTERCRKIRTSFR